MTTAWWLGHILAGAWLAAALVWLYRVLAGGAAFRPQSFLARALQFWPLIAAAILLCSSSLSTGMLAIRFVPYSVTWLAVGTALAIVGLLAAIRNHFTGLLLAVAGTAIYVGEVRGLMALALAGLGSVRLARERPLS